MGGGALKETLKETHVVTAFLRHDGRVLVVRRSGAVRTYQGRWSAISGYLEDASPLEQALTEIEEETGLARGDVRLAAEGAPVEIADEEIGTRWIVHPFLFDIDDPQAVRLDWENLEARWVAPDELAALDTVPALAEAYAHCRI